jgi:hypothetical protein
MYGPPPIMIDMPSDLDDQVAVQLITLLRAFSDALEQHYAGALARQQQHDWQSRQPSLWPDDDPPF